MNPVCCTVDTCEVSCTTCNCCGTRVRRQQSPGSNENDDDEIDDDESTLPLADNNFSEPKEKWSADSLSSSAGDIAPSDNNNKNNSFVSSKVSSVASIFGLLPNANGSNKGLKERVFSQDEIQSTGKLAVRRRSSLFKTNSCPLIFVNNRKLSIKSVEELHASKEKLVRDWLATQPSPKSLRNSPKKRVNSAKSGKSQKSGSAKNSIGSILLAEVFPGLTQDELEPDEDSLDEFFGTKTVS